MAEISKRGKEWLNFSIKVLDHVENYTVKQYGDRGDDLCTNYSYQDCIKQILKYSTRLDREIMRPGEELLDLKKIAHYAAMATTKFEEEKK